MGERRRWGGRVLALVSAGAALLGACTSRPPDAPATQTATRLAMVTQPAGTTSGQALSTQPAVELQDAAGTRVTGATGSVTASLASGTGTLTGTLTVAAVDGLATFTNLAVTGNGGFTLRFMSGSLTEAVSTGFTLATPVGGSLLVAAGASVLKYDVATGASQGTFTTGGALAYAYDVILGPDGYVYVADFTNKTILRFDAQSGAGRGIFASLSALPCSPYRIAFGPDANLYVGCSGGAVRRLNGTDGSSMGTLVPPPGTGGDMGGFVFHEGSIFVSYIASPNGTLVQYDASTGALVATLYSGFFSNGPRSPLFGPDGSMYVPDWQTANVKRFAPTTHAFAGDFISEAGLAPISLAIAPSGELLVLSDPGGSDTVRRYDRTTGTFLGTLVAAGSGGLTRAAAMVIVP